MSDNNVTGSGPELDISKVKEKQRKKHYEPENPIVENEAYEPKSTDTDADGKKEDYDPEEEYIPNDNYPISEADAQFNKPKKKPQPTPVVDS